MAEFDELDRPQTAGAFLRQLIRKVFLEDWMMKLLALGITFALWVGVTGLSTPTTTRISGIPLSLRFANNTDVTNSPIQEVDIVISGDKRKIAQINKNDLVVSYDLTDTVPGDRVITLAPQTVSISLPTGVRLDEVQPNRVAVRLESVEEKVVAVRAETTGELPEGFEIYDQTVTPAKVRIRGPANAIKAVSAVSTDPIDLRSRNGDFTAVQVPVAISNPKITPLDSVVDVSFRIGEKRVEKTFSVPVKDEPKRKATVTLYGGRSLFTAVQPQDITVQVVKEANGQDAPRLSLPPSLDGKVEIRKVKLGN